LPFFTLRKLTFSNQSLPTCCSENKIQKIQKFQLLPYRIVRVNVPPPLSVEFQGHGGSVHDLVGLAGFWCVVFSESSEINGSFGNAHECPSRTEINGKLMILNVITGKLVTLN
jgi:hypothetical protein